MREWVKRAEDDEMNIKSVLTHRDGTPAYVCFLSQQMAEKYLKSLLLHVSGDYPKIHELTELSAQLEPYFGAVAERMKDDTALLTPYYVGTRYPADIPLESFTWELAEEAFAAVCRIKEFVLGKIKL